MDERTSPTENPVAAAASSVDPLALRCDPIKHFPQEIIDEIFSYVASAEPDIIVSLLDVSAGWSAAIKRSRPAWTWLVIDTTKATGVSELIRARRWADMSPNHAWTTSLDLTLYAAGHYRSAYQYAGNVPRAVNCSEEQLQSLWAVLSVFLPKVRDLRLVWEAPSPPSPTFANLCQDVRCIWLNSGVRIRQARSKEFELLPYLLHPDATSLRLLWGRHDSHIGIGLKSGQLTSLETVDWQVFPSSSKTTGQAIRNAFRAALKSAPKLTRFTVHYGRSCTLPLATSDRISKPGIVDLWEAETNTSMLAEIEMPDLTSIALGQAWRPLLRAEKILSTLVNWAQIRVLDFNNIGGLYEKDAPFVIDLLRQTPDLRVLKLQFARDQVACQCEVFRALKGGHLHWRMLWRLDIDVDDIGHSGGQPVAWEALEEVVNSRLVGIPADEEYCSNNTDWWQHIESLRIKNAALGPAEILHRLKDNVEHFCACHPRKHETDCSW